LKEAFDFIFGGGLEYMLNYKDRNNGSFSILLNLSRYGIIGDYKKDKDPGDVVELVCGKYARSHLFYKSGQFDYTVLWLTSKQYKDEDLESAMRAKESWFFPLMIEVFPKLKYVATKDVYGEQITTQISRISDIPAKIEWYKQYSWNKEKVRPDSIYIRVKARSSRYALFEMYKQHWVKAKKILDDLKIDYKVVE